MSDSKLGDAIKRVEDCRRMNAYIGGATNREEQCSGISTDDLAIVLQAARTLFEQQSPKDARNVPLAGPEAEY